VAWALVAVWIVSLGMQLMGTSFERMVMAPTVVIGLLTHVRIAVGDAQDRAPAK